MKYLQSGGFQKNPLMRLTLGLALVLLAGFWATNLALYFAHMSLDPASVVSYYRGNEQEFVAPRSAESLLEVTHMHLPMFAIVLLLLTHLLIFAPFGSRAKIALIVTAFLSALLSEAAAWMTRFWHPGFGVLKVAMFATFQLTLAILIVGLGVFLLQGSRERHPARKSRPGSHGRV